MNRRLHISGTGWFAIGLANTLHYLALGIIALLACVLLLAVLTHDSDHIQIRCRIDHTISVWSAPHGAAESMLPSRCNAATEVAP